MYINYLKNKYTKITKKNGAQFYVFGNGGQRYVKRCVKLTTHEEPVKGIQVIQVNNFDIQVIYLDIQVNTGN